MDRATWDELRLALALYNGSLIKLLVKREDKPRFANDPARMASPAAGIPNSRVHWPALTRAPS
jgi:hypothetical protein